MPLQIKDGDIPQLEVDYQRGAEDIYKSVEITSPIYRSRSYNPWKAGVA